MNNPLHYVDPNGESTRVAIDEDGHWNVTGGDIDDGDNGIYEENEDGENGELLGHSLSAGSFFQDDNDDGEGIWRGTIDPNSTEGKDFIENETENTSVVGYIINRKKMDFKDRDSEGMTQEELEEHRY